MNWRTFDCDFCPRLVDNRKQVVVATPCLEGGVLVVGEAPGKKEDANGIGFVGGAGKEIRAMLRCQGLTEPQFGVANVCRCWPPQGKRNNKSFQTSPTDGEISRCLPYLVNLIREVKPRVIIAMGKPSIEVFMGKCATIDDAITAARDNKYLASVLLENAHPIIINGHLEKVEYIIPMAHVSGRNTHEYIMSPCESVKKAIECYKKKPKEKGTT